MANHVTPKGNGWSSDHAVAGGDQITFTDAPTILDYLRERSPIAGDVLLDVAPIQLDGGSPSIHPTADSGEDVETSGTSGSSGSQKQPPVTIKLSGLGGGGRWPGAQARVPGTPNAPNLFNELPKPTQPAGASSSGSGESVWLWVGLAVVIAGAWWWWGHRKKQKQLAAQGAAPPPPSREG